MSDTVETTPVVDPVQLVSDCFEASNALRAKIAVLQKELEPLIKAEESAIGELEKKYPQLAKRLRDQFKRSPGRPKGSGKKSTAEMDTDDDEEDTELEGVRSNNVTV